MNRYALLLIMLMSMGSFARVSLGLGGSHRLSWSTEEGKSYQLQKGSDEEGWSDIGTVQTGDASDHEYVADDDTGEYRLRVSTPPVIEVTDLIENGGFELGAGVEVNHWSLSSRTERVETESYEGSYSVRARVQNVGTTPSSAHLSFTTAVGGGAVVEGQEYELNFWAKTVESGVSYVQQYRVQWLDAQGVVVESGSITGYGTSSTEWQQVSESGLVAPAGAEGVRVWFYFVTGAVADVVGETFIDEVSLSYQTVYEVDDTYESLTAQEGRALNWETEYGVEYQLYESADLTSWSESGPALRGDGRPYASHLTAGDGSRYYQVVSTEPVVNIVDLYDEQTVPEPEILVETEDALITYMADRARDRHAREDMFQAYDHYLSWYWEERSLSLEIIDYVAKGGDSITFNYTTQAPLGAPEFRAFYLGENTVAEYYLNLLATEVGTNQYTVTIDSHERERRALAIGDLIEIEISQFLEGATNGRDNYYGTTFLYVVGTGVVPWYGVGDMLDSVPVPESAWLGGLTTLPFQYSDEPDHRYKQTAGNIAPASIQPFLQGRRLHHTDFLDGSHSESGNPVFSEQVNHLDGQYIARSCVSCHVNNGRGLLPAVGQSVDHAVVQVAADAFGTPHEVLGSVLQPLSTDDDGEGAIRLSGFVIQEGVYGDGTSYELRQPQYGFEGEAPSFYSVRMSQQLIGLGLLEAIPEESLESLADPDDDDGDGISGRVQVVVDPETGEDRVGRFTHKAGQASVRHQIAAALNTDMGVTSPVYLTTDAGHTDAVPDLDEDELQEMTRYISLLGVGARRDFENETALQGETLFSTAGCADCHTPTMVTGSFHPMAELRNQTIHPYTDLLLHDMGDGLADNVGEGRASGAEWRTPPLWNIGLTAGVSGGEGYLHDGRARTLEEAILWHGGEATAAKEAFRLMSASDRAALVSFLKSL